MYHVLSALIPLLMAVSLVRQELTVLINTLSLPAIVLVYPVIRRLDSQVVVFVLVTAILAI